MSRRKQRKLESTMAAVQRRYGPQALCKAHQLVQQATPPHISTGFAQLDAITGCDGIPLGGISLLSGRATSGKLTVAYKALAQAQGPTDRYTRPATVALVDFNRHTDPDYLARCAVDLAHLLVVYPQPESDVVSLIGDLVKSRQVRLLLVDSLIGLICFQGVAQRLDSLLRSLSQLLRQANCALLLIDEPQPPWWRRLHDWRWDRAWPVRQRAALHIEIKRERWLRRQGILTGYRAQAHVLKSRWRYDRPSTLVEIQFNGTVEARPTW
jgi:hypothetical protein